MSLRFALIVLIALASSVAISADQNSLQERRETIRIRSLASTNALLSRPQLSALCSAVDGARWCEGYIAAILTVYQIPLNCLPRTDMAPFANGQVWELTVQWILRQEQDSKLSFFDAVTGALAEEKRCPMGNLLPYNGPELVPYSDLELEEMQYLMNPTPLAEVTPDYPPAAQRDGIEGWAQISFTVTEMGDVKDVVLVDSEPPEIFDAASIEAASKLKFRPIMINGIAKEALNIQYVFRFNL